MTISANLSSINAHAQGMDTSASNVANINTENYKSRSTALSGSESGVKASSSQQSSSTELTKELSDQIVIEKGIQANVDAIKTQDQMIGSLLDIKG